ncbi:MAG: 2-oxo-4-hydroxy-4-carboxy-5-ureidoimidazoline decarboxylase [Microbacterium sp.]
MRLEEFNATSHEAAILIARVWADVPGWAEAIVAARPFANVDELERAAAQGAEMWGRSELDVALADHPRIGEKHSGEGASADASEREQASMASASDDVAARLAAGNRAYEERFGRVFLIRAAGRSPQEMLAELERRLTNDDDTEVREACQQLAQIAQLRLRTTFQEG